MVNTVKWFLGSILLLWTVFVGAQNFNTNATAIKLNTDTVSYFKPYTSAEIHFTVPINRTFSDNSGTALTVQDGTSTYNDNCVIQLPSTYRAHGRKTRLVIYGHGSGQTVSAVDWDGWNYLITDSLKNNGYAILNCNGGQNSYNFGGIQCMQSLEKGYEYAIQNYNLYEDVFLLGMSMGGLTALNFANWHQSKVKAVALLAPVVDIYNQAWLKPWANYTKPGIGYAFNFPDTTTWCADCVVGYNPIKRNWSISGTDTLVNISTPLKIWMPKTDNIVDANYTINYSRYVKNAGGYVELRLLNSSDHNYYKGNNPVAAEVILWLRRFERGKN